MIATTKPGPAPADGARKRTPTRVKPAVLALLTAALAAIVAFPAIVFACSGQASFTVSPGEGLAGDPVQVVGQSFFAAPVTVTWNGATGPVIGTAQGPDIDLSVHVPTGAAPGVYYITASSSNGSQTYRASASFRVNSVTTGGGTGTGTGTTAQPGRGSASTSGPATATDDRPVNASTSGASGNSTGSTAAPSPTGSFASDPASSGTNGEVATTGTGRAPAGSAAATAPPAASGSAAAVAGGALTSPRPTSASAPVAGTAQAGGANTQTSTVEGPNIARLPDGHVVSGDLWSGFNSPDGRSLPVGLDGPSRTSTAGGPSVQLIGGVVLVALSAMAMGGTLVATARTRRRRVAA